MPGIVKSKNISLVYSVSSARHVDANKDRYIQALREAVAIKSVSAWPAYRPDITKMINWTADRMKALGVTIELAEIGTQTLHDGCTLPLPAVLLGQLGKVSDRCILYYCGR